MHRDIVGRRTFAGKSVNPRTDSWSTGVDRTDIRWQTAQTGRIPDPKRATTIDAFERGFHQPDQMLNPSQATAGRPGVPFFAPTSVAMHRTWGSLEGGRTNSMVEMPMATPPIGLGRVALSNVSSPGSATGARSNVSSPGSATRPETLGNRGPQGTATADGPGFTKTSNPPMHGVNPANNGFNDPPSWAVAPISTTQPMRGLTPANRDLNDPRFWTIDRRADRTRSTNANSNVPPFLRPGRAERERSRTTVIGTQREPHLLIRTQREPTLPVVFHPEEVTGKQQQSVGRGGSQPPSAKVLFPPGSPALGTQREPTLPVGFLPEGVTGNQQQSVGRAGSQPPSAKVLFPPGSPALGTQREPTLPVGFLPEGVTGNQQQSVGRAGSQPPSATVLFPPGGHPAFFPADQPQFDQSGGSTSASAIELSEPDRALKRAVTQNPPRGLPRQHPVPARQFSSVSFPRPGPSTGPGEPYAVARGRIGPLDLPNFMFPPPPPGPPPSSAAKPAERVAVGPQGVPSRAASRPSDASEGNPESDSRRAGAGQVERGGITLSPEEITESSPAGASSLGETAAAPTPEAAPGVVAPGSEDATSPKHVNGEKSLPPAAARDQPRRGLSEPSPSAPSVAREPRRKGVPPPRRESTRESSLNTRGKRSEERRVGKECRN